MAVREANSSFLIIILIVAVGFIVADAPPSSDPLPKVKLVPEHLVKAETIKTQQPRKVMQDFDLEDSIEQDAYPRFEIVKEVERDHGHNPYDDDDDVVYSHGIIDSVDEHQNELWYPGNIFLGHETDFTKGFESFEIRVTTHLIRFKINEMSTIMKECIETYFTTHLVPNYNHVKQECVGLNFQVLFQTYEENMRRLRQILMELLRVKTAKMEANYTNEKDFFFDLMENFMERDLDLPKSLRVAAKTMHYFINEPRFLKILVLAEPEINAFDELHKELKKVRTDIQRMIDGHTDEAEKYLETLQEQIDHGLVTQEAEKPPAAHHESSEESESSKSNSASSSESESSSESSSSSSSSSESSESSSSTGGHHHHHEEYPKEKEEKEKQPKEDDDDEPDEDENEAEPDPMVEGMAAEGEGADTNSLRSRAKRQLKNSHSEGTIGKPKV